MLAHSRVSGFGHRRGLPAAVRLSITGCLGSSQLRLTAISRARALRYQTLLSSMTCRPVQHRMLSEASSASISPRRPRAWEIQRPATPVGARRSRAERPTPTWHSSPSGRTAADTGHPRHLRHAPRTGSGGGLCGNRPSANGGLRCNRLVRATAVCEMMNTHHVPAAAPATGRVMLAAINEPGHRPR